MTKPGLFVTDGSTRRHIQPKDILGVVLWLNGKDPYLPYNPYITPIIEAMRARRRPVDVKEDGS